MELYNGMVDALLHSFLRGTVHHALILSASVYLQDLRRRSLMTITSRSAHFIMPSWAACLSPLDLDLVLLLLGEKMMAYTGDTPLAERNIEPNCFLLCRFPQDLRDVPHGRGRSAHALALAKLSFVHERNA